VETSGHPHEKYPQVGRCIKSHPRLQKGLELRLPPGTEGEKQALVDKFRSTIAFYCD